jgi:hypothetical protein
MDNKADFPQKMLFNHNPIYRVSGRDGRLPNEVINGTTTDGISTA